MLARVGGRGPLAPLPRVKAQVRECMIASTIRHDVAGLGGRAQAVNWPGTAAQPSAAMPPPAPPVPAAGSSVLGPGPLVPQVPVQQIPSQPTQLTVDQGTFDELGPWFISLQSDPDFAPFYPAESFRFEVAPSRSGQSQNVWDLKISPIREEDNSSGPTVFNYHVGVAPR